MTDYFHKPIAIGLSPNTENEDFKEALNIIFKPQIWKSGGSVKKVEEWFKRYFSVNTAFTFNAGRSALTVLLKSFGIGRGDDVLLQAFTCVAVPNSIRWAYAKPVFVDIDSSFNIEPNDFEKKITGKTKAVIVQHTFGISAQIDKIIKIAKDHNIIVIEDCAHSLGARYKGKLLGSFGDASVFSFGRDKVVSSVFGGAAIINSKLKTQNSKLNINHDILPLPSQFWIFQQLLHPILLSPILASYNIYLGKALLVLLQKLRLLSLPVYKEEMCSICPKVFPSRYPNALAILLEIQLKKLSRYNLRRQYIADKYFKALKGKKDYILPPKIDGAIYFRFPVLVDNPQKLYQKARKHFVYLGKWYQNIIDPKGVDKGILGYELGSCPSAEHAAKHIINLPTYPTLTDNEIDDVFDILLSA